MFGLRRLYVPIGELRAYLSPKLELNEDEFNEHFRRLKASEFGERIKLYGGPPDAYESEDSLSYKGKSYLFFSLKRD
jgi:hypothetical protein